MGLEIHEQRIWRRIKLVVGLKVNEIEHKNKKV